MTELTSSSTFGSLSGAQSSSSSDRRGIARMTCSASTVTSVPGFSIVRRTSSICLGAVRSRDVRVVAAGVQHERVGLAAEQQIEQIPEAVFIEGFAVDRDAEELVE